MAGPVRQRRGDQSVCSVQACELLQQGVPDQALEGRTQGRVCSTHRTGDELKCAEYCGTVSESKKKIAQAASRIKNLMLLRLPAFVCTRFTDDLNSIALSHGGADMNSGVLVSCEGLALAT